MGLFKSKDERRIEREMKIRQGLRSIEKSIRQQEKFSEDFIKNAQHARKIGDDANLIKQLPALTGRVFDVAVSKDGKSIAAGSALDNAGQLLIAPYPAEFDKKMSLLYLHSGDQGLDEGIHKAAEDLYNTLQKGGSKNVVFRDAKGLGHEWQTWRIAFHDFAPRLFQPKK